MQLLSKPMLVRIFELLVASFTPAASFSVAGNFACLNHVSSSLPIYD